MSASEVKIEENTPKNIKNPQDIALQIDPPQANLENLNKEKTEIQKNSEPFWFSKLLYQKSHYFCPSCIFFLLALVATVTSGGFLKMNEGSGRDFLVWSDEKVKRVDAAELAIDDFQKEIQGKEVPSERSIENKALQTFMIYKLKKGTTLFTTENIQTMQKIEKKFTTFEHDGMTYKDFCLSKSTTDSTCASPDSIPLIMTNSDSYSASVSQNQINQILQDYQQNDDSFEEDLKQLLDKNVNQNDIKVQSARSMYYFGFPLKGFKDSIDEDDDQYEKFKLWNREFFKYIDEDQSTDTMEVLYFNEPALTDYGNAQLGKDIILSVIAGGFVTVYMIIHTKSFAIGLMGSFLMYITFPVSFFFYRLIFQVKYLIPLHTSVLFLLMGIGADDVFVFFDSYQQAGLIPELSKDLQKRVSYSYRKASKAMLVTSSTTMIAFLATAVSRLLPIKTYGIFAAINVATNYFLIITIFPSFLILREKYYMKKEQKQKEQDEESQKERQKSYEGDSPKNSVVSKVSQISPVPENLQKELQQIQQQQEQKQEKKLSKMQIFFDKYWFNWIKKAKFGILVFFIALISFNFYGISQLETPSEPSIMAKDSHFLAKARKYLKNDFPKGSDDGNSIQINLIWGIEGVNQNDVGMYDSSDQGELIYDNSFDLAKNQEKMIEICQKLRSNTYKNLVSQQNNSVTCFMDDFKRYAETVYSGRNFPVPQNDFNQIFGEFLAHDLGQETKSTNKAGYIGGKVKYAIVTFIGNQHAQTGRNILEPLNEEYENMVQNINKSMPLGLNKAFQFSYTWLWMTSEKELVNGAINGIIISLSLAFVILLLSTCNIIISLFSITCIIGVVSGVLMIIWASGWDFGANESMNSIIIIGLSVDYIVHLANAYIESEKIEREEKTKEMLTVMGVSVLGGGITTLGAGLFLFAGKLQVFLVMGVLVSSTIGFSLAWALLVFPSLTILVGPTKDTGDIKVLYYKLKNMIQRKKE